MNAPQVIDRQETEEDAPQPRTQPLGEGVDPAHGQVRVDIAPDAPANELSLRRWLRDDLQWVQDEAGTISPLALSRRQVMIGYKHRDPGDDPPLVVRGTIQAAGLRVADADGIAIEFHDLPPRAEAPVPGRLHTLLIDPETGQLYIG